MCLKVVQICSPGFSWMPPGLGHFQNLCERPQQSQRSQIRGCFVSNSLLSPFVALYFSPLWKTDLNSFLPTVCSFRQQFVLLMIQTSVCYQHSYHTEFCTGSKAQHSCVLRTRISSVLDKTSSCCKFLCVLSISCALPGLSWTRDSRMKTCSLYCTVRL